MMLIFFVTVRHQHFRKAIRGSAWHDAIAIALRERSDVVDACVYYNEIEIYDPRNYNASQFYPSTELVDLLMEIDKTGNIPFGGEFTVEFDSTTHTARIKHPPSTLPLIHHKE